MLPVGKIIEFAWLVSARHLLSNSIGGIHDVDFNPGHRGARTTQQEQNIDTEIDSVARERVLVDSRPTLGEG